MACLYKRRKQYWISYYIGGKQVQKSLHTSSEKVAKAKKKKIGYQLSLGELQAACAPFSDESNNREPYMVRATRYIFHKSSKPRHWRTHKDAFEGLWYEVVDLLQQEPDVTAKSL